jgi:endonuclease I
MYVNIHFYIYIQKQATDTQNEGVLVETWEKRFPFQQRRAHFKARLKTLENDIIDLHNEKKHIDSDRGNLTFIMENKQTIAIDMKIEKDRVTRMDGECIYK